MIVGLQDPYGSFYIDSTIYEVTAQSKSIEYVDSENGEKTQIVKLVDLVVDKCSQFYTKGDFEEDNLEIALDQVFCIKPNSASLRGFWGIFGTYESLSVSIDKCQNTTKNNNHCKSQDDIDNAIQNGFISMDYSVFQIDQNNHSNPLKKVFYDDYNLLNANSSLQYSIEVTPTKFKTDEGMIFQNVNEVEGFDHHIRIFNQMTRSRNIVNIVFQGSSVGTVFMRGYVKLQTVITQIGGFIKFLMLAASFMSQIFSKNYYFAEVLFENSRGESDGKNVEISSNVNINQISINNNNNNFLNYKHIQDKQELVEDSNKNIIRKSSSIKSQNNNFPHLNLVTNFGKRFSTLVKTPVNNDNVIENLKRQENSVNIFKPIQNVNMLSSSRKTPTTIMLDYLKNKFFICKSEEAKCANYRMMKNFEYLYRKTTSVDILFKKFFELEMLTYLSKSHQYNLDDLFKHSLIISVSDNSNSSDLNKFPFKKVSKSSLFVQPFFESKTE